MQDLGERLWDFSWARTKSQAEGVSWFRWRDLDTGEEFYCREIIGATDGPNCFLKGEGDPDHLMILTHLFLDDLGKPVAYVYPPEQMPPDEYEAVRELPQSHYRMCARVDQQDFRCRDERSGELRFVKDFVGPAVLNWIDGGTHVFHDGRVAIDADNIAHLIPA